MERREAMDKRMLERIHIIDDDATTVIETKSPDSEEEFGEEAPQIADVIDESSNSQKMQAGKWKTIADTTESCHRNRLDSDSDLSPPRNDLSADKELSFQHANFKSNDLSKKDPSDNAALYAKSDHHQRKRLDSDSDLSPPRPQLNKRESDCDLSPPRSNSMHVSSPKRALTKDGHRRKRLDSDSDLSPPRSQSNKHKRQSGSDLSPPRSNSKHASSPKRALTKDGHQRKRLDSDSDLSPPRSHSDKHKRQSDSDLSPPRLNLKHANSSKRASTEEIPRKKQKHLYSDISPTKHKLTADETAISRQKHSHETSSDSDLSPLRTNSKHTKSKKDGKKSRHLSIKSEKKSEDVQRRVSDKKEKTVGEKEETKEKQSESNNSRSTLSNTATAKSEEDCSISFGNDNEPWVPELFKPLARYRDDPELDEYLKKQERSGDTMLEYIRGKQRKEPSKENIAHPVYKGPPPPPNRFNIMPGYRWDGVDRSNGFEKRYFDLQAKKKSQAELAYKWSVENM